MSPDPNDVRTIRVRGVDHAGIVLARHGNGGIAALYWTGYTWREVMTKVSRVGERCTLTAAQIAALPKEEP